MGKSTEITDMVLQQQPENEFCNLTDTLTNNLNSINNNKINNGSHGGDNDDNNDDEEQEVNMEQADDDDDFMAIDHQQNQQQIPQQVPDIENDDNNNRDNANNFGPETDVDAILDDEEFHLVNVASGGGEKELTQMEFKETADVIDHAMQFQPQQQQENPSSNAMFGTLENKIFGEIFPEMKGGNPFEMAHELMDNFVANVDMPLDNKIMEEQIDEMQHELQQQFEYGANDFIEKVENVEREIDFAVHETAASADGFMEELISSANNEEEVAIHQEEEQPQQQPGESQSFFNVVHMSKKEQV